MIKSLASFVLAFTDEDAKSFVYHANARSSVSLDKFHSNPIPKLLLHFCRQRNRIFSKYLKANFSVSIKLSDLRLLKALLIFDIASRAALLAYSWENYN